MKVPLSWHAGHATQFTQLVQHVVYKLQCAVDQSYYDPAQAVAVLFTSTISLASTLDMNVTNHPSDNE